jgi:hypothetical protein
MESVAVELTNQNLYTDRLLFPHSIILECAKSGIKPLASLLLEYNYYLKKIRKIDDNLNVSELNFFSVAKSYFTSRYKYKFIVDKFEETEKKIIEWLYKSNSKIPWSNLFVKHNIKLDNIKVFMNITKHSDKYMYGDVKLSQRHIIKLLPKCSSIIKLDGSDDLENMTDSETVC